MNCYDFVFRAIFSEYVMIYTKLLATKRQNMTFQRREERKTGWQTKKLSIKQQHIKSRVHALTILKNDPCDQETWKSSLRKKIWVLAQFFIQTLTALAGLSQAGG